MTHLTKFAAAILFCAAACGLAVAADTTEPAPYLTKAEEPAALKFLPAYPAPGSAAQADDEDAFTRTRALATSSDPADKARWAMATGDANKKPDAVAADFSCAVGTALGPATTPKLVTLIARIQKDASAVTGPAKDGFHRTRPLVGNNAPVCEDRAKVTPDDSYPSGHTTMGWLVGLVLSEIAPDREAEILARARAYGESRVVCGVHWPSDVEAGRMTGAAVFAALQDSAAFQSDLAAAKQELAAARANPAMPDAARCAIEDNAATHRPW